MDIFCSMEKYWLRILIVKIIHKINVMNTTEKPESPLKHLLRTGIFAYINAVTNYFDKWP